MRVAFDEYRFINLKYVITSILEVYESLMSELYHLFLFFDLGRLPHRWAKFRDISLQGDASTVVELLHLSCREVATLISPSLIVDCCPLAKSPRSMSCELLDAAH